MLGIISVKNSEMIDIEEAMSDYLLYKGKNLHHTHITFTPPPSYCCIIFWNSGYWMVSASTLLLSQVQALPLRQGFREYEGVYGETVLLPGKSYGWRSLVGCSPWGR